MAPYSPGYLTTIDKCHFRCLKPLVTLRNVLTSLVVIFLHLLLIANEASSSTEETSIQDKPTFEKSNCSGNFSSSSNKIFTSLPKTKITQYCNYIVSIVSKI